MSTATAISPRRKLWIVLPCLDAMGLMTGVVYLVFFAWSFVSFTDPDYWWHLRTGQLIVQDLSIPHHDVFSFTVVGQRWIAESWLAEVFIYLSVSKLGYAFTLACFSTATVASFGLMQRRLLRLGTQPIVAIALVFLGLAMSSTYWTVRPQLLTWCLLAVTINALIERRGPPWLLVPMMALWANIHPGFIFGLITIILWYASRLWDLRSDGMPSAWRSSTCFVVLCCLATLLNPSGPLLLIHRASFLPFVGSSADMQLIAEWASPNFHDNTHLPLMIGILLLIGLLYRGQVRDRFAVLLAMSFTLLALLSSRYQPMFAIAYLPAAGLAARGWHLPSFFGNGPNRSLVNWALLGVAALAVIATVPMLPKAQTHRQARTDSWISYPSEALTWVKQNRPDANVFANYSWGGYFLNGLYPDGRVFIDGRSDTYGRKVLDDYATIISAKDGWQETLESSGANVVVVPPKSQLASALQAASVWRRALETKTAVVYVRK